MATGKLKMYDRGYSFLTDDGGDRTYSCTYGPTALRHWALHPQRPRSFQLPSSQAAAARCLPFKCGRHEI